MILSNLLLRFCKRTGNVSGNGAATARLIACGRLWSGISRLFIPLPTGERLIRLYAHGYGSGVSRLHTAGPEVKGEDGAGALALRHHSADLPEAGRQTETAQALVVFPGATTGGIDGIAMGARCAPVLDVSVSELSPAFRGVFLLRILLNQDWEAVAGTLRVSSLKARVLVANAISKITKKVGKAGVVISPEELELACKTAGCVAPASEGLGLEVWESLRAVGGNGQSSDWRGESSARWGGFAGVAELRSVLRWLLFASQRLAGWAGISIRFRDIAGCWQCFCFGQRDMKRGRRPACCNQRDRGRRRQEAVN